MDEQVKNDGAPKDRLGRGLRDLRLSVIDACNLRCAYCMPEDRDHPLTFLKQRELLTVEEIRVLVTAAARLGVMKLRLTGGEPLMRRDLLAIVRCVTEIPGIEDVAMTTNGYWLREQAADLKAAGLGRLTVSLDTVNPERAEDLSGRPLDPQRILDGIAAAVEAGFRQIKVNAVVMKGKNDDEVVEMAELFRGTDRIVRFIEYMDVGTRNDWAPEGVVPGREIVDRIAAKYPLDPVPPRWHGEVATRYRYRDGKGEIGVITSVSKPFCRDCNRARVTADGKIYTCLFASEGRAIRSSLHDVEAAVCELRKVWLLREDRYSEIRAAERERGLRRPVEMNHVGG